jgi:hypothetical protein
MLNFLPGAPNNENPIVILRKSKLLSEKLLYCNGAFALRFNVRRRTSRPTGKSFPGCYNRDKQLDI